MSDAKIGAASTKVDLPAFRHSALANAMKYLWRADAKGTQITDLQKAAWYIGLEIESRSR